VIERKLPERNWRVGASLNLPFAPLGAEATAILDADIDSKTTHKGFLAYDATAAGKPEAYVIPFAKLVDGRLMVDPGTLVAARAALAGADFPGDVAAKATAVLDHYDAQMESAVESADETMARTKAGRVLSKATHARISSACKMIEEGHALIKAMLAEIESPEEDAGENEAEESTPDTGKAAPALTQRARDLAVLRLKAAH
jgi:hypothetical protein